MFASEDRPALRYVPLRISSQWQNAAFVRKSVPSIQLATLCEYVYLYTERGMNWKILLLQWDRTEQNRTEQERTGQDRTEEKRTEQKKASKHVKKSKSFRF
jgi:hypothetical protein